METKIFPIKAADLVMSPPRSEQGIRGILHQLAKGRGYVFGLAQIDHKDDIARERLLHIIGSHLEHLATDLTGESNPVRRFEQTLERLNADIGRVGQEISLRTDRFHAVVGVMVRNQIFLSGLGDLVALYLHKTGERKYSVYELHAQLKPEDTTTWEKPFSAVLDGELHPGDLFYVATRIPPHAMSGSELQETLITLPPAGALQRLRQFLPATSAYAGICAQVGEEERVTILKTTNSIGSVNELKASQERTAAYLGDHESEVASTIKNLTASVSSKLSMPGARDVGATAKKVLGLLIKISGIVAATLVKAGQAAGKGIKSLVERFSSRGTRRNTRERGNGLKQTFKFSLEDLGNPKKVIILSLLLIAVIASGMLFLNSRGKKESPDTVVFADTVKAIEDKTLAAEASLIYKNTVTARAAVNEALTALATLNPTTSEQQRIFDDLKTRLSDLQAKIRGFTAVKPTILATMPASEGNAKITSAVYNGTTLYVFADNLSLYRYNGLEKQLVKEPAVVGSISRITDATAESANGIFLDAAQRLGRADFAKLTVNPIASGAENMASTEDVALYAGNAYVLTAAGKQIVKMRPQGEGFEAGTAWITTANSDLSTARSFAIDGDIYILTANAVVRFRSGKEQPWPYAPIDPPLTGATDIWTDAVSQYVYILDPIEGRVLAFVKETGSLVAQYTDDSFKGALAMIIDEPGNRIVLTTESAILEFTPDHLIE
ncbi:hypothetical protein KBC55_02910 [Patescibacteria group bacterium]|nr:hypothetical protein [Patescibacteria group bacterium]